MKTYNDLNLYCNDVRVLTLDFGDLNDKCSGMTALLQGTSVKVDFVATTDTATNIIHRFVPGDKNTG